MQWTSVAAYSGFNFDQSVTVNVSYSTATMNLSGPVNGCAVYAAAAGNTGGSTFNLSGTVTSDVDVNIDSGGDDDQYGFAHATSLAAGAYTVTSSAAHTYQARGAVRLKPKDLITLVASDSQTFDTAGTQVFSLPAMEENDIVLLFGGHSGTGSSAFGTALASGWTSLENGVSAYQSYIAAYKIMGATPDTQIDVGDFATAGDANGVYIVAVYRGVDTSTPMDATFQVTAGSPGDNSLTPPAITTVTPQAVAVVAVLIDSAEGSQLSGPSGYTQLEFIQGSSTAQAAYNTIYTAGTETPGVMIGPDEEAYRAYTVALRPA